MIRGLYSAASGMISKQVQQENLSTNISNINTPGYKKDEVFLKSLEEKLVVKNVSNVLGIVHKKNIGYMEPGIGVDETLTSYEQGLIEGTDRNLDFAIEGAGFFTFVDENNEERYSRDGRFKVDNDGYLVNSQNGRILVRIDGSNEKQPIIIDKPDFSVNSMGVITGDIRTENGEKVSGRARIAISMFENPDAITKDGNNTFISNGEAEVDNISIIRQGCVERSNVDTIQSLVDMITIARSFESNQRVLQQIDETLSKTVNEVGSIR